MLITYFCKKGGVGKTTVLGEHADYLASTGKKVLLVSIDDQNSLFEMYGKFNEVFSREDNYIEHVLANLIKVEDAVIEFRPNIYGLKSLNTDMLSKKLTLERPFERTFVNLLKDLEKKFDYVFIDLPPSNCRTSEVVFENCNEIVLIVELTKLGVSGFYNTLQYFTDCGLNLGSIKYILPNGFAKNKNVPAVAMEDIITIAKENLPKAKILPALPEKASIQSLQQKGVVVFDSKNLKTLNSYQRQQKKLLMGVFSDLFKKMNY